MSRNSLVALLLVSAWVGIAAAAETEMQLQPDPDEPAPAPQVQGVKKVPFSTPAPKPQGNQGGFYSMSRDKNTVPPEDKKKPGKPSAAQEAINKKVDEIPLPYAKRDDVAKEQLVLPEITQKAVLSSLEMNWVLCRDTLKEIVCEDDKDIEVKNKGDHALLKYKHAPTGDESAYASTPTTCSAICGDVLYRLLVVPLPLVAPQTIRLDSGKAAKMRQNVALFRDDTTNRKVMKLMEMAYTDDIPDSFTVKREQSSPLTIFRDLAVNLVRTITVEGEGTAVKEFAIVPSVDGIDLNEKAFLREEISPNPLAIAFEPGKTKPAKGERVRMFVIELKGGPDVQP